MAAVPGCTGNHYKSNFFFAFSALEGMPKVFFYSTCELIILHIHFFVTCNQNFKCVHLKTTFFNLVDRFDKNLSALLSCSSFQFFGSSAAMARRRIFFLKSRSTFTPKKNPWKNRMNLKKNLVSRYFVIFFNKKNFLHDAGATDSLIKNPPLKIYSTEPTSRDGTREERGLKIMVNSFYVSDLRQ